MKNVFLIILFTIGISYNSYSQFSAGISAGVGPGLLRITNNSNLDYEVLHSSKAKFGYYGGVFLRYDFSQYYFQVTPSYLVKGKVKFTTSTREVVSLANDKIYLPLSFGKRFFPGLRVYIGGGIEILLTDNLDARDFFEAIYDETDFDYQSFEYYNPNMHIGASWDIANFGIGLQYSFGLLPDFYLDLDTSSLNIGGFWGHYLSSLFVTVNYKLY